MQFNYVYIQKLIYLIDGDSHNNQQTQFQLLQHTHHLYISNTQNYQMEILTTINKLMTTGESASDGYPRIVYPVSQRPSDPKDFSVGIESTMKPLPEYIKQETEGGLVHYKAANKLAGKKAIVTGGDSGIGRSVAVMYAMEGADVAIVYLPEEEGDAQLVKQIITGYGRKCLCLPLDMREEENCKKIIDETLKEFGSINILVNNASVCYYQNDVADITTLQFDRTMKTNIYGTFWLTKYAVPHLTKGDSIITTVSNVPYVGFAGILDYGMTKAAQVGMTRSLSNQLAPKGIRVNCVAPGPIWTPIQEHGIDQKGLIGMTLYPPTPMGRIGQPAELGPAYVFLACSDGSFITGQTIHVNGGYVLNG